MGDVCPGITRDQLRRLGRGVRTSPRPRHTAAAARKLTRRGGAGGGVRISGDGCGGGGGSGAGGRDGDRKWPRLAGADVAMVLVADQLDLRVDISLWLSAVSRRNLYPTAHHQSDAAATGAGDKEHCLQWRHGAMTTANPTHRRYPITITTADRAGAGPCPEPSPQLRSPRLVST